METFISNFFEWQVSLFERSAMIAGGLLFSVAAVLPGALIIYLTWLAVSASQRRQQRARCFIDLLEIGLKQGRTIEQTILSLSERRVRDMGVRFHLLAAWLERGTRLSAALAEVPRFLPPHISAMLKVGEEIGDVARVLPVCRATLKDASSDTQKSMNSVVVLLFVSPLGPALVWLLSIFVLPKLRDIARDMASENDLASGASLWSSAMFDWGLTLAIVTLAFWFLFWILGSFHGAGSGLFRRLVPGWSWLAGWVGFRVPWMRKRMQRDFSAMLSLLLDAGVPEEKAIRLAAEGTANHVFVMRAGRVMDELKQGVKLTEAVRWLDDAGEFRWRLRNACQTQNRFAAALCGWHEALEAKAFQQEQLFSQAVTTSFVLLNGLMVGLVTVGVFKMLVGITELALW